MVTNNLKHKRDDGATTTIGVLGIHNIQLQRKNHCSAGLVASPIGEFIASLHVELETS